MTVQGKVVLITGGSEGIGKAAAELLSSKGAKVAIAARSLDTLTEVAATLTDGYAVRVDMTNEQSIKDMIRDVHEHYGTIDILINNAGRAVRANALDIDIEDFKEIMELNVYGPLRALQAVVPLMKAEGGGMVLNISSNVSKMTLPMIGAYAATKYALNGLMLTAREELKEDGIIVGIMHPGLTDTKFGENAIKKDAPDYARPSGMKADSAEDVAHKILESIEHEPAEQYMSEEIERMYSRA
jgi:short-subunit dehydrogenase